MERRRLPPVDGELDDGHVGLGEEVPEYGPGSVVEAPGLVRLDVDGGQQCLYAGRQVRIAGGCVLDLLERIRETAEVVDRSAATAWPLPRTAGTYQWADTHRMAFGTGISAPTAAQPLVKALSSRVIMGLPWPKKMAGIGFPDGFASLFIFEDP